jgi:uncharacterized protein (UPF0548 family)
MFALHRPSDGKIEEFLRQAREMNLSYGEVGATSGTLPTGYAIDHNRCFLGYGEKTFHKAAAAVRSWKMFDLEWVRLFHPSAPIEGGSTVAVMFRHFGFWSLNANRIVYLINEDRRFGFAYGTLREHAEKGEERFCIDWNPQDDSVTYDILAFSTPQQWPARLAWPFARMLQKRFVLGSKAAMKRAVESRYEKLQDPG